MIASPGLAAPALQQMTQRVLDHYVIPHFETLKGATGKLAGDLDAACGGEKARFAAVQADFEAVVLDWAQVEFLRFGPMSVTGRPERFAYWPDPRGVMNRQLRSLIARRDQSALDAQTLAGKSAAVQGLTVMEALLTSGKHPLDGQDEEARYRCRLAVAVAQNLDTIAGNVLEDWRGADGWRARMLNTSPKDAVYRAPAEPPGDFARALITGLQMIQDRQVAPLIDAQASGKAPRLPFAQSGLSSRYIAAGVGSLRELYETMQLGASVPEAKAWMPRWVTAAFGRLAQDAPAALKKDAIARKGEERQRQLRILRFQIDGIRKLIGRELAPLAGLMIGFNELDGD